MHPCFFKDLGPVSISTIQRHIECETYNIDNDITVENIFKKHDITTIDLAIIDVEGSELELLKGINFKEVNINYFCIESYNIDKLKQFMNEKNYKFITKLHREDYVFKRIN